MGLMTEKEKEEALAVFEWHLDAINPIEHYKTAMDPSWRGLAVGMTIPAYITTAAYIVGSPLFSTGASWVPNMRGLAATRIWASHEMHRQAVRGTAWALQRMAPLGPLAVGFGLAYGTVKGLEYGIDRTFGESFRKSVKSDKRGGRDKSLFYYG